METGPRAPDRERIERPMTTATMPTLAETALGPRSRDWSFRIGAVLIGSLALTVSAKLQVPFYPVPVTMQTLVVLMLGAALGPRLGAATVLAYLAQGAAGLPVFAGTPEKGIGLAYMAGPTGGYLAGFVAGALLTGWLARRGWDRSVLSMAAANLAGTAVIFAFGIAWLGTLVGWDKPVLDWGLWPFMAGAALKIAIAAMAAPLLWRLVRR